MSDTIEFLGLKIEEILPDEDKRKRLAAYLKSEYNAVDTGDERSRFLDDVKTWKRQRLARPEHETRDFPWPNSANLVPPLIATATVGRYAALQASLNRRKPLWTVTSADKENKAAARAITNALDRLAENAFYINMPEKIRQIGYDLVSLGTYIVEIPWSTKRMSFKRSTKDGGYELVDKVIYDGPDVELYPIEDFYCRTYFSDVQQAPWVGLAKNVSIGSLKSLEARGFFENVDKIEGNEIAEKTDLQEAEHKIEGTSGEISPEIAKIYRLVKFFVSWDTDGDDIPEELVVWMEIGSGTILRIEYNELGRRFVVPLRYFFVPGQLYGVGLGWMGEHPQAEAEYLHNIRVNSMTLSSVQMGVTRNGCGIGPKEVIQPGRIFQVADTNNDLKLFGFPDVSGSTYPSERICESYIEKWTGATEPSMGLPDTTMKSRFTTSGYMMQANQGGAVFNEAIMANIEKGFAEIGLMIVLQMMANRERTLENIVPMLNEDDQQALTKILNEVTVEDLPNLFRFSVATTDVAKTEDAKKQNILTLTQLYSLFSQEVLNLQGQLSNPQVQQMPELATFIQRLIIGRTKIMEQTLDMFGVNETDDYLPYLRNVEMMLDYIDSMKEMQTQSLSAQLQQARRGNGPVEYGQAPVMGGAGAGGEEPPTGVPGGPALAGPQGIPGQTPRFP